MRVFVRITSKKTMEHDLSHRFLYFAAWKLRTGEALSLLPRSSFDGRNRPLRLVRQTWKEAPSTGPSMGSRNLKIVLMCISRSVTNIFNTRSPTILLTFSFSFHFVYFFLSFFPNEKHKLVFESRSDRASEYVPKENESIGIEIVCEFLKIVHFNKT